MTILSRFARFTAVASVATLAFAATANADPTFSSGNGITVDSQSKVDEQLFELKVTTPAVSPRATARGNGVRVFLPKGYEENTSKRYPVIYLFHGFTLSYNIWNDWMPKGTMQKMVGDKEVIIVMPDGGKGGWYTDWMDNSIPQRWETYHTQQLVPFIDANLRTIATRQGRATMGYSMGGLGAMRYAQARPDLFGTVASMSGALNLRDPGIVAAVLANATQGMNGFGAYGAPFWPFDGKWHAATPYNHAAKLKNTNVFLTAAQERAGVKSSSSNLGESFGMTLVEGVVRNATAGFDGLLTRAGIKHSYTNIGAPGVFEYGYCDGGHNVGCGAYSMNLLLPQMTAVMAKAG